MNDASRHDQSQFDSLYPEMKFSRRDFLASSLAAGFAVSAGPVMAQQAIHTPADGLEVGDVKVPVADGAMPAYFAAPAKAGKHATVIVVPEIWGLHEYQKDICRRLAKVGYYALSADPYFRQGELWKLTDIQQVMAGANSLADTQMLADLDALVTWIEKQPKADAARLGITGMCRGGRTVWMYAAHSRKIKAAVSWYGGLNADPPNMPQTPVDIAAKLNAPVLGLYGGADQGIPLDRIEALRAALKTAGKDRESIIRVYEGMPHAFHADYRPSYRKEAAEDGWKRMLAWLKQHGVS